MRMDFGELKQRPVVGASGRVVGEIDEMIIDPESWRVRFLRIRLRRAAGAELGAERSFFRAGRIEVPSEMVQSVGDAVVLRIDARELVRTTAEREVRSP